jgi:hypothetical protein
LHSHLSHAVRPSASRTASSSTTDREIPFPLSLQHAPGSADFPVRSTKRRDHGSGQGPERVVRQFRPTSGPIATSALWCLGHERTVSFAGRRGRRVETGPQRTGAKGQARPGPPFSCKRLVRRGRATERLVGEMRFARPPARLSASCDQPEYALAPRGSREAGRLLVPLCVPGC